VKFIEGDIRNYELMLEATQEVTTIFHFGALIGIPESREKSTETVEINALGTSNMLNAAKENRVKNIVSLFISSNLWR